MKKKHDAPRPPASPPPASPPPTLPPFLAAHPEGTLLRVHVQPNASRTEFAGTHGEALKLRLAAPPVDGKANAAAAEFLAQFFGLARARVTLLSGATSREKRFLLTGLVPAAAAARIAL